MIGSWKIAGGGGGLTAALALAGLLTPGCTSEPELVFADWLIDVPEATPVHEYAPVPLEGRDPNAVRMIEDLVIGGDLGDSEAVLFEPGAIVATDEGNILVADNGTVNVKVFDAGGNFIKTIGNQGQGPGEFGRINAMVTAGENLVIHDSRNNRFSVWTLEGAHVADHTLLDRANTRELHGLADGTLVGLSYTFGDDARTEAAVTRWTLEGEEISRVFEAGFRSQAVALDLEDPVGMMQKMVDVFDDPAIRFAAFADGTLLVTPSLEYQLLALTPDGSQRWALRVAWERTAWPEDQRQPFIDDVVGGMPIETPPTPADLTWPQRSMVMSDIDTDGAGRIYVFLGPRFGRYPAPDDAYPVDVYSPDGEFLAAGSVSQRWSFGAGDYLYGMRPNALDEIEVVRYRIEINQ